MTSLAFPGLNGLGYFQRPLRGLPPQKVSDIGVFRPPRSRGLTPGDVPYISFGEPVPADDSDVTDEGVIVRLRDGRIVGLTILNATKKVLLPPGS